MGMFRSETMKQGTLVLPVDRCRDFVELLGMNAHIEFVDMNAGSMQRAYRRYIQRIDEMERILRFLFEEIKRMPGTEIVEGDPDSFLTLPADKGYQLDQVEATLQRLYTQFQKFRENNDDLRAQRDAAREHYAVCRAAANSLNVDGSSSRAEGLVGFSNLAGVLAADDRQRFARTVFRATRGNAFTYFEPVLEDPSQLEPGEIQKFVFVVFFQQGGGAGQSAIREKLERICAAFGVNVYDWPRNNIEARAQQVELADVIADKSKALVAFEEFFVAETSALLEVHRPDGGGSLIEDYRLFCLREKAIYATLNMFEASDVTLRSDCWFPEAEEEQIRHLLMSRSTLSQVSAFLITERSRHANQSPPTYVRTTEFTEVFQSFVDTYGVPRYKEANPGLLTIVTFPFLFGIMYGDIGHGACILAFGIFLCLAWPRLRRIDDEMVQMIVGGRYMILLMGCFAVYAGFLYNDFFSLGLNLFGSSYKALPEDAAGKTTWVMKEGKGPYPLGIDPVWKGAENELLFLNSFKMKFAVIVGFVQMTAGVILKGMNCLYFKDGLSFVFEFIPQLLFMLALVGFMDLLIVVKWVTPMKQDFFNGHDNKPSVINTIIEMCMMRSPDSIIFHGQAPLMKICLVVMLIAIPVMLLPKPLILKWRHGRSQAGRRHSGGTVPAHDALDLLEAGGSQAVSQAARQEVDDEDEEDFEFGEIMIHQMIETIEYVLGAISNTASYLRLWALSLAHQQLSVVFFQMTVEMVLKMDLNPVLLGIILFFVFGLFAAITFGIMLCMDTLECFLHALRLQCRVTSAANLASLLRSMLCWDLELLLSILYLLASTMFP